ncbi:hypothetical protein L4174_006340 [Photobacterium sp. CCB-ST2H9]|uniref:hypothetical protein n=1 Tax=Photobacterium sp. CCB-ST2H9 TaxID=2912855 RepID=UPI0020043E7F|nr:hypothetical protein [Photobacterium sp. CCB-ST2H9]UTM58454.1 hypothetical protein L4174_006340 [Photobacterium sp. CCB-ST2H9]
MDGSIKTGLRGLFKVNVLQNLPEKIKSLRAGLISVEEFQTWINSASADELKLVPQGILLRLKRGGMDKVMLASVNILPDCVNCHGIYRQGVFESRNEHASCSKYVDQAVQGNVLVSIQKPKWYKPKAGQLGPESYYSCTSCGSIWNLVEPERQCNGLWERIA